MNKIAATALLLASMLAAPAVCAGEAVEVPLGGAAVVRLDGAARKVMVGNPAVADVTVDGPRTITVFGKFPGGTTLMVLDGADNALLDVAVVVMPGGPQSVVVRYGASKNPQVAGRSVVFDCTGQRCSAAYPLPTDSQFKAK